MVQRKLAPKEPPELTPQAKKPPKKNPDQEQGSMTKNSKMSEKNFAQEQESSRERSNTTVSMTPPAASKNRRALPNYMKPTSSSDAKKGQLEVTNCSVTSRGSSNSSNSSGRNHHLKRKLTKKCKGRVLFAKLHVNRATCSSTMKDCKFPMHLEISPGGTEAEGPSVLRVCPYTYCSLNGHGHEPLPPLKSFLASRRKLIKTQQSMKLKGVSPFRKKITCKDEKESVGRVASGVKIVPLIEEVVSDFFVEIYASSKEHGVGFDERSMEKKDSKEVCVKDWGRGSVGSDRGRISSDMSCSDLSVEEMDAMMRRLEYLSFDRPCGGGGDCEEEHVDVCCEVESESGTLKHSHMDLMENLEIFRDDQSDFSSECSDIVPENSFEFSGVNYRGYELAGESGNVDADKENILDDDCKEEISDQQEEKDKENIVDDGCKEVLSEEQAKKVEENILDDGSKEEISKEHEEIEKENILDDGCEVEISEELEETYEENILDDGCKEEISQEHQKVEFSDEMISNVMSEAEVSELVCSNANDTSDIETQKQPVEENVIDQHDDAEEGQNGEETADVGGDAQREITTCKLEDAAEEHSVAPDTDKFPPNGQLQEDDNSDDNGEIDGPAEDSKVEDCGIDDICNAFSEMSLKADACFDPSETDGCRKTRMIIARRRRTAEELEYMRSFNPRAPNFLPLEPDPEAEKVDLRHQMMDERKNAEEWMIDYALQRAVTKLAPARKKKVELLVEAFETVVPIHENSMPDDPKSFTQDRPIQACS